MSDKELTKEMSKLLEIARGNPASKMQSLKSQATKLIHKALAARREAIAELRQSQVRCAEYEKMYGFDSKEAYRRWHDEGWHGTDVSGWMMEYFGVWEHEKFIELSGRKEELSSVQLDYGQFQAQTFISGQAMTVAERYDALERELATLKAQENQDV